VGFYRGGVFCYGRGDYYRGDYYRGDIFGILGKAVKGIGGAIGGFIKGGPVGAIGGAISAVTGRPTTVTPPTIHLPVGGFPTISPPTITQGPVGGFGPQLPTGVGTVPTGSMTPQGFLPGCQLKGYRPNKSSYYKAVPGNPMAAVLIPKGSVCVKTRRMNIANPRALRRAVRRAQGFAKMARRVMTFVSAKATKGRAKFKKR
jgi:hypothetical protein